MAENFPITDYIHAEFERTMTATINASDLRWEAGQWPGHFYILGREGAFNFFSSITRKGELIAKVYRDSLGYDIIVSND